MSTNQYPGESPRKRGASSCLKAAGIGCLVIVVVIVALTIWGFSLAKKNPIFQRTMQETKVMGECSERMAKIGNALNTYAAQNGGKYPMKLDDLYPKYVTDKSMLQCPSGAQKGTVCSYEYVQPAPDAPGETVVLTCRHHVIVEGQPPMPIVLTKKGKVEADQQQFNPKPPAPTPTKP